jgi:hypothetical protein
MNLTCMLVPLRLAVHVANGKEQARRALRVHLPELRRISGLQVV